MRFRRRDTEVAPVDDEQAPPADAPPPGAPVAAFAAVLDGRRLWVAVDARPGSIGLRDVESGDVVALPDDAADDQPSYLAARLDLAGLADAEAVYEVVVVPLGGARTQPVWTPPLPERRVPLTPDGRTRFVLHRGEGGLLRLRRERVKPAAELVAVSTTRTAIELRITGATGPVGLVVDGEVVASWPGELIHDVTGDLLVVTIEPSALGGVAPTLARVAIGPDRLGVRRRHDDLLDPAKAALLPPLYTEDSDAQRMRLRWSPQGFLQAKVFADAAETDDTTDGEADE